MSWFGGAVFKKNFFNVNLHGYLALFMRVFFSIRKVRVNTCKLPSLPIYGDGVMFLGCVYQVLRVAFAKIFNPEVVDYDFKNNWVPFVAPESSN